MRPKEFLECVIYLTEGAYPCMLYGQRLSLVLKMILLIFTLGKQKKIPTTDGHTLMQILIHGLLWGGSLVRF